MNIALQGSAVANMVGYEAGESDDRPWGAWEVLATGPNYVVKRIAVKPGHRLSLQYHNHRSEHWTIVAGEADVDIGARRLRVVAGEHVQIGLREPHRIRNVGSQTLIFIETQIGQRLDESDIVRLVDDYGRINEPLA